MSVPPEQFARLPGHIDLATMQSRNAAIVGVGAAGSAIARELAYSGIGSLQLFDGKRLTPANLGRHVLRRESLGENKAEGVALLLDRELEGLQTEALARDLDASFSDIEIDHLLNKADLVVVATDHRETQRRIARRALALDLPAVIPGLYANGGGEVFVQLSPSDPCFNCWDGFRASEDALRGVGALRADTQGLVQIATELSIGLLDARSQYAERLRPEPGQTLIPQLFILQLDGGLTEAHHRPRRRPDCPSCAVGPSHLVAEPGMPTRRRRPQPTPSAAPSHSQSEDAPERRSAGWPSQVGMVIGTLLGFLAISFPWYYFWAEGFKGFRAWWNPVAFLPILWAVVLLLRD